MTFASIFLAELGDKTQLGVFSLSASSRAPFTIFIAASLALIAATFVGVLAGSLLARYVNLKILKLAGGLIFVLIGLWILFRRE